MALAKGVISAAVLAAGFRAVSDDDFARVVIAEQWARSPRWDASGTSWLPLPFWITGSAMLALGRGLLAARVAAVALGMAAAAVVYLAARWLGEDRGCAAAAALAASIFPWSARLGAATVPELPAAALVVLGMAAVGGEAQGGERDRRLLWGSAAVSAAALARYEAWPAALIVAAAAAFEALRERRWQRGAAAAAALIGPCAWLANNRAAHGDALHFLARVAAYKQALGASEPGAGARLWAYPIAMIEQEPEVAAALAAAVIVVALRGEIGAAISRYRWPAAIAAAQIAALSAAMVKDGAPTHHPERAVLSALILAAMIAGALAARAARGRWWHAAPIAIAALAAALSLRPRAPREAFAARGDEEAAGRAAAALSRPGERVLIEVADYGYLAVIAALGRPEDAVPDRSVDPRDAKVASSFGEAASITGRAASAGARWVVARAGEPARAALGEPRARAGAWGVFRAGGADP